MASVVHSMRKLKTVCVDEINRDYIINIFVFAKKKESKSICANKGPFSTALAIELVCMRNLTNGL